MDRIDVDIDPLPKPRMVRSDSWKKRPIVLRYWMYKDEMKLKCRRFKLGAAFKVVFVIPMPKSWSQKKRNLMEALPHQQRPDIDNLTKGLMDILCEEDSHIHWIEARKVWGTHGKIIIENKL